MGRSASTLVGLFTGAEVIVAETALQLETVTGVPTHIWLGLEAGIDSPSTRAGRRRTFWDSPDGLRPRR